MEVLNKGLNIAMIKYSHVTSARMKPLLNSLFINPHLSISIYQKHARWWMPSRMRSLKLCAAMPICANNRTWDNKATRVLGQTDAEGWRWQDAHWAPGLEFLEELQTTAVRSDGTIHDLVCLEWTKASETATPLGCTIVCSMRLWLPYSV